MPASTLSGRSVSAIAREPGQLHFGRPINFTRKLHKNQKNSPQSEQRISEPGKLESCGSKFYLIGCPTNIPQ